MLGCYLGIEEFDKKNIPEGRQEPLISVLHGVPEPAKPVINYHHDLKLPLILLAICYFFCIFVTISVIKIVFLLTLAGFSLCASHTFAFTN